MPRTRKGCSTPRQVAYARRVFDGKGINKKQIALDVGYTSNAANSIVSKIENTVGFNAAMMKLAADSNNLALAAMHEFKVRGFTEFSNKDLVAALNAIGGAWAKFNARQDGLDENHERLSKGNKLRTIVMNHIEQQTINQIDKDEKVIRVKEEKVIDVEADKLDF